MKIKLQDGMFFHLSSQSIFTSFFASSSLIKMLKRNYLNESMIEAMNPVLVYVPFFSVLIQLLFSVKNERGQIHPHAYEWVAKAMVLSMVLASLTIVNNVNEIEMKSVKGVGV